jgi:hypothetical protein
LPLGEVLQHNSSVTANVGHIVCTLNNPARVNEVGNAQRIVRVLMIGRTENLVERSDGPVPIGEQGERKMLRFTKRFVLFERVERSSKNDTVSVKKINGSVTQRLALNRSAGCRGLRVPPEQHPMTSLIFERDESPVLVW